MLGASCVSELSISICVCGLAMLGALLVMVSCMRGDCMCMRGGFSA